MKYNLVVCGGTFDNLHKGHKEFLKFVLLNGKKVLVGLTSDNFVKNKNQKEKIQKFEKRKKVLLTFLSKDVSRAEIIAIDDIFGPTLSKELKIDAIVVSQSLIKSAELINKKREEKGLPKIKIIISPMILGMDGNIISSSRIREGKTDREGLPLKTLFLPNDLRPTLQAPFGNLFKNEDIDLTNIDPKLLITVGDVTTRFFNQKGLKPKISVVDFRVQREEKFNTFKDLGFTDNPEVIEIENPTGCLKPAVFKTVSQLFSLPVKAGKIIKIIGEEDLVVLPLIISAPIQNVIFYGQREEGLVRVDVSMEAKKRALELLSKFSIG